MQTNPIIKPGLYRRSLIGGAAAACALLAVPLARANPGVQAEVWKDPDCGCCKEWVAHLQANGFTVKVNDTGNESARARLGVAQKYGACHTALIGGYAIEGHVPAREIHRLLKERPQVIGLAVAGMPVGSPGMDGAIYGNRSDPYSVMLLAKDGSASVYQQYPGTSSAANAQATAAAPASASGLTEAEVRKVDKANKKVTLKHGEIKSLDMPAMTMVFQIADASALDKLQPGDKVRFRAVHEAGKYTVTEIQPVK
jgi:hypothetical protein